MSVRNFARVYREVTGYTPAKAVERIRVAAARNLLEGTTLPVSEVAQETGFEDDERLRRAMQRAVGISPTQYRERFGFGEF
ncbi:MAG: helix-turn-helix domain-containing protein [Pseudomonadota bacterium]